MTTKDKELLAEFAKAAIPPIIEEAIRLDIPNESAVIQTMNFAESILKEYKKRTGEDDMNKYPNTHTWIKYHFGFNDSEMKRLEKYSAEDIARIINEYIKETAP